MSVQKRETALRNRQHRAARILHAQARLNGHVGFALAAVGRERLNPQN